MTISTIKHMQIRVGKITARVARINLLYYYMNHSLKLFHRSLKISSFLLKIFSNPDADDLVIILKHKHLPRTIKEIQQVCEKFNL